MFNRKIISDLKDSSERKSCLGRIRSTYFGLKIIAQCPQLKLEGYMPPDGLSLSLSYSTHGCCHSMVNVGVNPIHRGGK